jgi:Na+-driven multidrug efflux pump
VVQVLAAGAFFVVLAPRLRPARSRRPQRSELAAMLVVGRHLLVRVGGVLAAIVGATAVAARVDEATLAANQIVMQAYNLLALVADALAIPAQTLVAEALGGAGLGLAITIGRRVLRLSFFVGAGLGLLVALAAWPLPHLFTTDAAVASRATAGLLVLAIVQLPAVVAMGLDGVLIGGGDYRFLARASIANLLAFAPLALATLAWPSLGIVGVWAAMLSWMVARALTNGVRLERGRWVHAL